MPLYTPNLLRRFAAALEGTRGITEPEVTLVTSGEDPTRVVACTNEDEIAEATERMGRNAILLRSCAAVPEPSKEWTVVSIVVTLRDDHRREETHHIDPDRTDALFWSVSAVRQFLVPHYARIFGAEWASRFEEEYRADPVPLCRHCNLSSTDLTGC